MDLLRKDSILEIDVIYHSFWKLLSRYFEIMGMASEGSKISFLRRPLTLLPLDSEYVFSLLYLILFLKHFRIINTIMLQHLFLSLQKSIHRCQNLL